MPQNSIIARPIRRQRYFVIQNTDAVRLLIFPFVITFFRVFFFYDNCVKKAIFARAHIIVRIIRNQSLAQTKSKSDGT